MSDITNVVMPKWGLSMTTGRVTEWLVEEGEEVSAGDDLLEIDTDKIAGALESPAGGVLRRQIAELDEPVPVGATIALLAPAEVPEEEIDQAAKAAREQLEAGAVEESAGPEIGKVTVDGREIAYARMGSEGEHIVLVHGYGGDKNSWLFVQEPLSSSYLVDAIDLPGHGESTKDVGDGSLDVLAQAVTGYLAERGIERAHLVGHSLGGAVAIAAAAAAPAQVASLTLIAPAGVGPDINADYLRGFAQAQSRRELQPHLTALFADPSLATRQLADDLMKYKRLDGVDASLNALLATLLDGDRAGIEVAPLLSSTRVPVRVVWGEADAVVPISNAEGLADRADVTRVPDAGHMAHMEQPSAVVRAVTSAVEATPAQQPA
ncbi:acetoin dehydrogenase dihydrolipoyllysine-residue acetyltransferase subunit [Calidifontibacter sp. DB0510]|uniref:Acetoin dehydrogenase dihydrolipoyllysine-residue acetyltransferase subunit n=1 Tax=Metallococcus carri TaxID=1656884 RepID=A0A967B136_9MICO|nr:acetoin dehydrogenase dihydrolipoyllysine-residue acetyltransferase subunit [Metallococcus carri]NHN56363.1 acetoin dehydrogenase dihydrolipoyllysine-residue acetyltransferase subunit [Metallococcus carri]NOP35987.1 acetoin dehydrogenase dihydrolipoyllysine-residue acetyltransferase subunit [Calidifontibacter sp. DB2511S]